MNHKLMTNNWNCVSEPSTKANTLTHTVRNAFWLNNSNAEFWGWNTATTTRTKIVFPIRNKRNVFNFYSIRNEFSSQPKIIIRRTHLCRIRFLLLAAWIVFRMKGKKRARDAHTDVSKRESNLIKAEQQSKKNTTRFARKGRARAWRSF